MSVEKWAWRESCDNDYCPGDCDHCIKADEYEWEDVEESEEEEDGTE